MHVLYEATFSMDSGLGILAILPIVFLIFTVQSRRKAKQTGKTGDKIGVGIGVFALISLLIILAFVVPDRVKMYDATVGAYQRGEYQTVEGYVENFHPMPEQGHDMESFTINGVSFEYSDFTSQFGYHNARSRGGVITGNGQHLKIGYTNYGWLGNVIVYIEELP